MSSTSRHKKPFILQAQMPLGSVLRLDIGSSLKGDKASDNSIPVDPRLMMRAPYCWWPLRSHFAKATKRQSQHHFVSKPGVAQKIRWNEHQTVNAWSG